MHDIGLIGLAVMGQNLVLNMANHGFSVAVYNRTTSVTDQFVGGLKASRPTRFIRARPIGSRAITKLRTSSPD
jgi:6-phosphogluconate dehydrogenase